MKIIFLIIVFIFVSVSSIPHEIRPKFQKANINPALDAGSYRLPNTSFPESYEINLITHIHEDDEEVKFKFEGKVSIVVKVTENTKSLILHKKQLKIEPLNVTNLSDNKPIFPEDNGYGENEFNFLAVENALGSFEKDKKYQIDINFIGELRDDNLGFYKSSYVNEKGDTIWLATTQFQNVEARSVFPCYDEPGIRATYKISITHGSQYTAISNTKGTRKILNDNEAITEFDETPAMQTYLIAFIISDFKSVSSNSFANIPQSVYAKPQSIDRGEADLALRYGQAILDKFEENLKLKYHLPKMDQVALPDFDAGAMENWGLVTYREEYLLFNKLKSRTQQKENVMTVISHEFAHQYFGDFVSPAWWSYLWLNEGFATLYEWYLVSLIYKEDRLMDSFILNVVQLALAYDGNDVRAMTTYVETPDEIDDLFDDIAYEKSGSVLRMMQNVIGESAWERGLNYYLTEMSLKSATSEDLYRGLQKAIDEEGVSYIDIATVMSSWETQSGYPVVYVEWNKNELKLTQERFLYDSSKVSQNLWHIPINYVVGTNPNFDSRSPDLWINRDKSITISKENAPKKWRNVDWIVVNAQQGYYYRVNYDDNLWSLLTNQLYKDHLKIHTLNRAQLLDDSFQLARAKKIEFTMALNVIKYLVSETDYVPWESAYNGITLFKIWLEGTSAIDKYQKFIQTLVTPIFNQNGMEVIDYEHKFDRYLRSLSIQLACQFNIKSCIDSASLKLEDALNDKEISADLQAAIYQNALRHANSLTFERMITKMLNTEDQGQRTLIITSLGCSSNKDLQKMLLKLAIDDAANVRRQERLRIFNAWTNGGTAGIEGAIEFITTDYEKIEEIQGGRVNSMLSSISTRITNLSLFTKFSQLITLLKSKGIVSDVNEAKYLNNGQEIINWQSENLDKINDWLDRNDAKSLVSTTFMVLFSFCLRIFL